MSHLHKVLCSHCRANHKHQGYLLAEIRCEMRPITPPVIPPKTSSLLAQGFMSMAMSLSAGSSRGCHLCRRLVMMRHAESEERLQSIRDHDRPITDEGRSSAREVRL